jgi:SH3-like domain-containing protein
MTPIEKLQYISNHGVALLPSDIAKVEAEIWLLKQENQELRQALRNARIEAKARMVTMRKFAMEWCKITPSQLSEWTGELPTTPPDFID